LAETALSSTVSRPTTTLDKTTTTTVSALFVLYLADDDQTKDRVHFRHARSNLFLGLCSKDLTSDHAALRIKVLDRVSSSGQKAKKSAQALNSDQQAGISDVPLSNTSVYELVFHACMFRTLQHNY